MSERTEYMPIEGMELSDLQFMYSLYRVLKDSEALKPRLSSLGLWWRYRGLLAQLHNLFDAAWKTLPPEKRDRINRIWSQQELRVVNRCAPVDPTGDMVTVPKESLVLIGQHCQKQSCSMCFGTHSDRKDCLFRKGMNKLSLPDLRKIEKQTGKSIGQLFDWGNQ